MRWNTIAAVMLVVAIASLALNAYQYASPRLATVTTTEVKTSLVPCTSDSPLPVSTTITTNADEAAMICVRFYYYDPGSNITKLLNPLDYISIKGMHANGSFNALSNFTINVKPANISIGGSPNMNEGDVVVYTILARPIGEGTYNLGFGWLAPQIFSCGHEFTLISGGGRPDFSFAAGCITMEHGNPPQPFPPGVLPNGTVFAEPIFAINASTA